MINPKKNIATAKIPYSNIARYILIFTGGVFYLSAAICNEFLMALFDPSPPLSANTISKIRLIQIVYLGTGTFMILLSFLIGKMRLLNFLMDKKTAVGILLSLLVIFVPCSILEVALRQNPSFDSRKTRIFIADSELGWKLRPSTEDIWFGIRVKINGKGLRGPELSYEKPDNVKRILYLGDSVTFGYDIENYEDTYPYQTEKILEKKSSVDIQTINAGVGGYSPWQEYIYLKNEGIKYNPDLVVLSFILNDVTEKFGLLQYGGSDISYQMANTVNAWIDYLSNRSSVVHFTRKFAARFFIGKNIQKSAVEKEVYNVGNLIYNPDLPEIKQAWQITLENLQDITDFCDERQIPVLLVVFPFTIQFSDIEKSSSPQKILAEFAKTNRVPILDLLPLIHRTINEEGTSPENYFQDKNHLLILGCRLISRFIADIIMENGLLQDAAESQFSIP